MQPGQLCFLSDQYYIDFPDGNLMGNKPGGKGGPHNRPCFYAFPDTQRPEICWVVPVSSRYEKYEKIAEAKKRRYGNCPTIRLGVALGRRAAFLVQNMCPATAKYMTPYVNKDNEPVRIGGDVAADVRRNAQYVLALEKRGRRIIFPDVFRIYRALCADMEQQGAPPASRAIDNEWRIRDNEVRTNRNTNGRTT